MKKLRRRQFQKQILINFCMCATLLLLTGCGISKEEARQKLADKNIKYSQESFFSHIQEGDIKIVHLFLAAGMDPEAHDNRGNTALMYASSSSSSQTKILESLLNAGANPDTKTTNGGTALMGASQRGQTKIVKILLKADADPTISTEDGWTALLLASRYDRFKIIKALLTAGADPNIHNKDGATSLRLAMGYSRDGHLKSDPYGRGDITIDQVILTVHTLLDGGADPTLKSKADRDPIPESPLEIAREGNYPEITSILREAILKE